MWRTALIILVASGTVVSCRGALFTSSSRFETLPGFNLSTLDGEQLDTFRKVVSHQICPCGHRHFVADCIATKAKCRASRLLARYALRRIKAGDKLSRVVLMVDRLFNEDRSKLKLVEKNSPIRGNATAPVTVVVFSDFECPFCKGAEAELRKLVKHYGSKMRLVFRHYPLRIHKNAFLASMAAVAAHRQGKFWEMHDLLFANQTRLKRANLVEYAQKLKLDLDKFSADLVSPRSRARVETDRRLAVALKLGGTPAIFVNGKAVQGPNTFENYKDHVEHVLTMRDKDKK